jgi:hypothetical protein
MRFRTVRAQFTGSPNEYSTLQQTKDLKERISDTGPANKSFLCFAGPLCLTGLSEDLIRPIKRSSINPDALWPLTDPHIRQVILSMKDSKTPLST